MSTAENLPPLTSRRPYLLRATYEWLLDNHLTPHVVVDTSVDDVRVPPGYAEDGKIVLNVSPSATQNFQVTNSYLMFDARFSGRAMSVSAPVGAVLAIYGRENGEGMMFDGVEAPTTAPAPEDQPPPDPAPDRPEGRQRGHLKVVK